MKNKIFDDIKTLIDTPNLCGEGCSNVGSSMVYLNEYGKIVVSVSNNNGITGYYAEDINVLSTNIDNDAIDYIVNVLQLEKTRRRINNSPMGN